MRGFNDKLLILSLRWFCCALAVIGYRARGLNWSRSMRWCLVVNLICEHALAGMLEQRNRLRGLMLHGAKEDLAD